MKKIILLLTIAFVWWHNATSQSSSGVEQYYYMSSKVNTISPRVWYQSNKGWYTEGRYNYEAAKTASVLAGKTFEKEHTISYSITPMAGLVAGQFNGGAIAENATVGYKRFLFSVQSQYTFSMQSGVQNFLYGWSDLSYQVSNGLVAGMSLQHTRLAGEQPRSDKGFFLKGQMGKWELPVYIFNAESKEREIILGLIFTYR